MKKLITNLDYIVLYAETLKKDNSLFKQQKSLIESQLNANHSLSKNMFSQENFKKEAREYLKRLGLINPASLFKR